MTRRRRTASTEWPTIIPHQFCDGCGTRLGATALVCPACLAPSPLARVKHGRRRASDRKD